MRLENITWSQAKDYFENNDMVILGIGSCECHGTHLPLGTDTLIPNYLISMIEKRTNILIAPTIPYGSCDYFSGFPGTVSLGTQCLHQVLKQVLISLFNAGARKFVVVNGHGGNIPAIEMAAYDLNKNGALIAILNWWQMVGSLNPMWEGGHAGGVETAAIMAIDTNLVDWAAIQNSDFKDVSSQILVSGLKTVKFKDIDITMPRDVASISENGWIGKDEPFIAKQGWGSEMLVKFADYLIDFLEAFQDVNIP